jgi:phage terminase small subunit
MSGPLKNARHERFAQELAKGKAQHDAFATAGFGAKGNAARANASRLLTDANVSARVAELKARAAEKVIVTVADIAQQLDEDREFARKLNVPAAAVSATMGKAKVLGLLEDKTRVDITTAGRPLGLGDFYGNGSAGG